MTEHDTLRRFVFEHTQVRGELVHLDASWRAVLARHAYPPPVRDLLGQAMAAAMLLVATLKVQGTLTLQLRGDGPVSLLVVQAGSARTLRGLAHAAEDVRPAPLSELCGDARLVITIDPEQGRERYQGIVMLEGATLAQALENYFAVSEQLATRLWLAVDERQAAGMLLQALPGSADDADAWPRAVTLAETLRDEELLQLPAQDILHRLYHEDDIRLFESLPVSFRCTCTRARIETVLRGLGYDEVQDILTEQGVIGVNCEFCNQRYEFDAVDAERLFAAHLPPAVPKTRH
jgi:molecular chaperone Hsp33